MKLENVVILMSDAVTGIAYARELSPFEVNLIVRQLQALDNGELKLIEVEPVIIRSKGMSDERAAQLLAMQELTDMRQEDEQEAARKAQDDGREIDRIGVEAQEQKDAERLAKNFNEQLRQQASANKAYEGRKP